MAFLIRSIQRKVDGSDIVRENEVDSESLTIGRAAENDIHLPDLAVEQKHAIIEPAGEGQLQARALGTLGFTLNGKTVQEGAINLGSGAELGFGTYRLSLSGSGDGAPVVEIRQVEEVEGGADPSTGFALASALPSKRTMSWVAVIAVLIAFLAIPVFTHLTRDRVENDPTGETKGQVLMDASWSAGDLSMAHHSLEENCESCHVNAFVSVQDETCLSCHEEIADHADVPRQVKGRGPMSWGDEFQWAVATSLGKEGPGTCATCHMEHEGMVKNNEPEGQQFCADCHDGMDAHLPDTELGNAADFGKAHPQFQVAVFTDGGQEEPVRVSMDGNPDEYSGLRFPHALHMNARGGVARMATSLGAGRGYGAPLECSDCHTPNDNNFMFEPVNMEEDCEACHSLTISGGARKLTHGDVATMRAELRTVNLGARARPNPNARRRPGEFARGGRYFQDFGRPSASYLAISRALSRGGVCGDCHLPTTVDGNMDVMPVKEQERFFLKGWFDHAEHGEDVAECTECHAGDTSNAAADLLMPGIAVCRDCHLGEFAEKASEEIVPSDCAMCHAYHPREGGMPDDDDHDEKRRAGQIALIGRR